MTSHNMGRKSHTENGSNLTFSWHLRRSVINVKSMVAAHDREVVQVHLPVEPPQPRKNIQTAPIPVSYSVNSRNCWQLSKLAAIEDVKN
jgi:hypothetical protein